MMGGGRVKKRVVRIAAGSVLFAAAMILEKSAGPVSTVIFVASYITVGWDVVLKAVKNTLHGNVFDENFLMTVASVGALFVGALPEGAAVMLFYQVGELLQGYAVDKSRKSIAGLMDIRPDYANVMRGGEPVSVDPDEVNIGDIIVVRPGERIPLDGKVIDGRSSIDTSALTGESVPRGAKAGSEIMSGCVNLTGVLTVEVTKEYGDSTVSRVLDLVENASGRKSNSEQFITKFARYYTPAVVITAAVIALLPPLLIQGAKFGEWIYRALTFLVVSCPCALVISVPLSFFGGIGGASARGILVKGGNYLEALAQMETVVFDKTGTLTKGVFNVREICPAGVSPDFLLELAVYAESGSNHPIAQSLRRAWGRETDNTRTADITELPGHGVSALVDGKKILAGNAGLMEEAGIVFPGIDTAGTVVHIAADGAYLGCIIIDDEIKSDSARAICELRKAGVQEVVMMTGDADSVGREAARTLGIDKVYTELLPTDKVEKLEMLLDEKPAKSKLAFVGDGINDAPVLARADIGIAMGGLGSDAAIEAADVVIMTDEPSKIPEAVRISRRTLTIARQNIALALVIKAAVLVLAAVGIATMWEAVFADVGVTVIAVLNALRALGPGFGRGSGEKKAEACVLEPEAPADE